MNRREAIAAISAGPLIALKRSGNRFSRAAANEVREGDVLYFVNDEAVDLASICNQELPPGTLIAVRVRQGMSIRDEIIIHRVDGSES
jgi:hypothetical protein